MHNTIIPTIQFTERTDLQRLHFAMIATRQPKDADTIYIIFQQPKAEQANPSIPPLSERETIAA